MSRIRVDVLLYLHFLVPKTLRESRPLIRRNRHSDSRKYAIMIEMFVDLSMIENYGGAGQSGMASYR